MTVRITGAKERRIEKKDNKLACMVFQKLKKTYSHLNGDPRRTEKRAQVKGRNYSLILGDYGASCLGKSIIYPGTK